MRYEMSTLDGFMYVILGISILGSLGAVEVNNIGIAQSLVQILIATMLMCMIRINRVASVRRSRKRLDGIKSFMLDPKNKNKLLLNADYDGDPIQIRGVN